jgi:hypothetical protein
MDNRDGSIGTEIKVVLTPGSFAAVDKDCLTLLLLRFTMTQRGYNLTSRRASWRQPADINKFGMLTTDSRKGETQMKGAYVCGIMPTEELEYLAACLNLHSAYVVFCTHPSMPSVYTCHFGRGSILQRVYKANLEQ